MNKKILPVSIASIILVVFLAVAFLVFDASSHVDISGIQGSYAEKFAKENNINFIALHDSDNPDIEIPKIKEETEKKNKETKDETKSKEENVSADKENEDFTYDYVGKTVNVVLYKGNDRVVVIPDTIDNLPVTKLSMNVLDRGIDGVFIPESVTEIETSFSSPRYNADFFTAIAIVILGYSFALIATFIGLKKSETSEETFYGIPFVYSGLITFILIVIWSGISLLIRINVLLQIIVAVVIFMFAAIRLFKASAARKIVVERGEQIKSQISFIKSLTIDSENLIKRAKSDTVKSYCKKVYETVRYSDPMSTEVLSDIEAKITEKMNEFSNAVISDDSEKVMDISDELITLIGERNNKCKAFK